MRDHFSEMLQPADRLTMVKRVLTAIWLGVVLVQVLVWLIICLVGGFEWPWWLWTVLGGGVVLGGLHLYDRNR